MPLIDQFDKGSAMTKEWLSQFGKDHRVNAILEDTMISGKETEPISKAGTINIAIIGAGAIAQRGHIPEFLSIDGVKIIAVADVNLEKAKCVAQKAGIPQYFGNYEKMLGLDELDAVTICTPNYLHAPITKASCDAGKHVLCEKPMATSVEAAQEMIDAAARNNVILMIEQAKRFTPPVEIAKSLLQMGIVGDILAVRSKFGHAGAQAWSPMGSWFFQREKSGGGVLVDLGIHHADLINWYTEGMEIESITGMTSSALNKQWEVEDYAMGIMKFSSGAMASLEVSWCTNPQFDGTEIVGTKGTLFVNYPGMPEVVFQAASKTNERFVPQIPGESKYGSPFQHFIDCVRERHRPLTTGEVGRDALKIVSAIRESAELGREIKMNSQKDG